MSFIRGLGIQIIAKTKLVKNTHKLLMIKFRYLFRCAAFLPRPYCHRCSVTITSGNIKHPVTFQPIISCKNITRQQGCNMSYVKGTIGIRPRTANNYVFHCKPPFQNILKKLPPRNIISGTRAKLRGTTQIHPFLTKWTSSSTGKSYRLPILYLYNGRSRRSLKE